MPWTQVFIRSVTMSRRGRAEEGGGGAAGGPPPWRPSGSFQADKNRPLDMPVRPRYDGGPIVYRKRLFPLLLMRPCCPGRGMTRVGPAPISSGLSFRELPSANFATVRTTDGEPHSSKHVDGQRLDPRSCLGLCVCLTDPPSVRALRGQVQRRLQGPQGRIKVRHAPVRARCLAPSCPKPGPRAARSSSGT